MAPTMKAILEMDVAALKAACEEAGLAIKEERKPILQETLLSHHYPTPSANATVSQQAPAAQDLQTLLKLKPESLTALQDGGYDSVEDIALLAQDPTFPTNLEFIPVPRDRLAILSHLKKTANTSVLFVHSTQPTPAPVFSHKPTQPKKHECIDLEAEDVRNEIMEIRMDKARYATTNNDARDVIEASRQHRQDKRSRGRDRRDSSGSSTGSSSDRSSSRSRSRSRRRKHSRRSGESLDRSRSEKYRLSKHGYDLPRPHHVVKPDSLKGKDKRAKPEDLTAMEHIYGNVDTAHRLAKKIEGKHAPALQELLEYTGYQVRNFQSYKEEAVLLLDDEFRRQAKRDRLSLSDQAARDRLSHFHLNPQNARKFGSLVPARNGSTNRYVPSSINSSTPACYKHNNDRCNRPTCQYTHACSACGDPKHKAYNCTKSTCSAGSTSGAK